MPSFSIKVATDKDSSKVSFEEAKALLAPFKLKNNNEFRVLFQNNPDIRAKIPSSPSRYYKEFTTIYDFLSYTKEVSIRDKRVIREGIEYASYNEVLEFIKKNNITNRNQWHAASKPKNIPDDLNIYKNYGFQSYLKLFKTGRVKSLRFIPYEEAKSIVSELGITTSRQYEDAYKSGTIPKSLPRQPHRAYIGLGWIDWKSFLSSKKKRLSYNDFKVFLSKQNVSSYPEYLSYRESYQGDIFLPASPAHTYSEFISYPELFGQGNSYSSMTGTKAAKIISVIESKLGIPLTSLSHAELVAILQTIPEGRALLLANITTYKIYDLSAELSLKGFSMKSISDGSVNYLENWLESIQQQADFQIPSSLIQEMAEIILTKIIEDNRLIDKFKKAAQYQNNPALTLALKNLESLYNLPDLSRQQYKSLDIQSLNLMQRYVAYQMTKRDRYGNWSTPGTGKTLSGVYAAYVSKAKRILVFGVKDTFDKWQHTFESVYGEITVLKSHYDNLPKGPVVNLVNYDQVRTFNRFDRIKTLAQCEYDFIILDETHLIKINKSYHSFRRESINTLFDASKSKAKFLLITATPFVNNLKEAKSTLKLVEPDFNIKINNRASVIIDFYNAFRKLGARFNVRPDMDIEIREPEINISYKSYQQIVTESKTILELEKQFVKIKSQELRQELVPGTIVYIHYHSNIIGPLKKLIENNGFSCSVYTGDLKKGLKEFLQQESQVLICTRAIVNGVDGLQKKANRIVILSPMWTSTEYDQFIARVYRQGSAFQKVDVIIPKIKVKGIDTNKITDWDSHRWRKIFEKRSLLDSVLNGHLNDDVGFSKEGLFKQLKEALK